jgi:hypothetical protein
MEESATYQYLLNKGAVRQAIKIVLRIGTQRFGSPPDAQTVATINAIPDLEHLERLMDRALEVSSWQELLAPPSS